MIIDCDTHLMPREAFDGLDGEFGPRKPNLKFNNDGLYVDVEFPGYPRKFPEPAHCLPPVLVRCSRVCGTFNRAW